MVVSVVASRLACEVCYVYRSAMTVSPSVVVLCFTLSTVGNRVKGRLPPLVIGVMQQV